jgi:hypothetical protein
MLLMPTSSRASVMVCDHMDALWLRFGFESGNGTHHLAAQVDSLYAQLGILAYKYPTTQHLVHADVWWRRTTNRLALWSKSMRETLLAVKRKQQVCRCSPTPFARRWRWPSPDSP